MELMENHFENMKSIQMFRCIFIDKQSKSLFRYFHLNISTQNTILSIQIKSNNSIDNYKAKYICLGFEISSVSCFAQEI